MKLERTIVKLLVSVLWQCKEKQYLDQFITLVLFSYLLVAPFLENVILEELLAGGMVVWLLILKYRKGSALMEEYFNKTKPRPFMS